MVRAGYSNPLLNILSRILARMGAPQIAGMAKLPAGLETAASSNALQEHPIALARSVGNAY